MKIALRYLSFFLPVFFGALFIGSGAAAQADFVATNPQRFNQALAALQEKDMKRFSRLEKQMRGNVLWPYLRYAQLRADIRKAKPFEIKQFLRKETTLPISATLRRAWLLELARRKQWREFLRFDTVKKNGALLACARAQALAATGRHQQAEQLARRLWLVGYSQPQICEPAFDLLKNKGRLPSELIEKRVILALQAGNLSLSRYLTSLLPNKQKRSTQRWLAVYTAPEDLRIPSFASRLDGRYADRAITAALINLGRKHPAQAHVLWKAIKTHMTHRIRPAQTQRIERTIAVFAAIDALPEARRWLTALPKGAQNASSRAWSVRAALRAGDWQAVLAAIRLMPASQRREDVWQYWEARALLQQGDYTTGRALARQVATHYSYYGFLAADLVDGSYARGPQPKEINALLEQRVAKQRFTRIALALHQADHPAWAGAVWRSLLARLSPKERQTAAFLAAKQNWAYGAYAAAVRSPGRGASAATFPRAHRMAVKLAATENGISPDLILALMRQESTFRSTVCSSAGACGLMQLMPATACWIGQKTGRNQRWCIPAKLGHPGTNIRAGSTYLAYLLNRFSGDTVAALAAYNAGPGTVSQWLSKPVLRADSARWIATLPYGETRRYIEQVLFNLVVYAHIRPTQNASNEHLALRLNDFFGARSIAATPST